MTDESAKKEVKPVQVTVDQDLSTATINGTKIEISSEGNVVVFTNNGVQVKPSEAVAAATKDKQISIGEGFNSVAMYGASITVAADGQLLVSTNGIVTVKPGAANDTAIAAAQVALILGQQTADGVYAGLTSDGKQQIFAMPKDLDVTMAFNDAAKAVEKLNTANAFDHNDWQIPSLDNLRVLQKNQNEGSLKDTFTTASFSGPGCPAWYWSSTPDRDYPVGVDNVRFSDGNEGWFPKNYFRLSCRPVRLVDVPRV